MSYAEISQRIIASAISMEVSTANLLSIESKLIRTLIERDESYGNLIFLNHQIASILNCIKNAEIKLVDSMQKRI